MHLLCLTLSLLHASSSLALAERNFKGQLPLDINVLRSEGLKEKGHHLHHLVRSLTESPHSKLIEFTESKDFSETLKTADRKDPKFVSEASYTTKVQYTRHEASKYMDLENHPMEKLLSLGPDHVEHCSEEAKNAEVGSFVIASGAHENWIPSALKNKISDDKVVGPVPISRQIVGKSVSTSDAQCTVLRTLYIHPLEMFSHVKIESSGLYPFDIVQARPIDNKIIERELLSDMVRPDPPVRSCDDPYFAGYSGENIKYGSSSSDVMISACIGFTCAYGCAEISMDLGGSWNFNYDPKKGSASTDVLQIADGITCKNCYAFLGAGFLVIVEGSLSEGLMFEAKIGGGMGFNVQIDVDNPDVSGSKPVQLIGASDQWLDLKLGSSGLRLSFNFGGLIATISGTGSATGKASLGAGYKTEASIALIYANYGLSTPVKFSSTSIPPFMTFDNFNIKSMSLTAQVSGIENFKISYYFTSASSVSASFSLSISESVQYSYNIADRVNARVTMGKKLPSNPQSRLLAANTFFPGDTLFIQFLYDGFLPDEETVVFYSISIPGKGERSIALETFITSSSGEGTLSLEWLVPWDHELFSSERHGFVIIARASNLLSKEYRSDEFDLEIFTETDGIFQSPSAGDILQAGSSVEFIWNASLLHYFEPVLGSAGHGREGTTKFVTIEIVGESLYPNGSLASEFIIRNFTRPPIVTNTGTLVAYIPTDIGSSTDRFYVNIIDANFSNIRGWSSGYFFIKNSHKNIEKSVGLLDAPSHKMRQITRHVDLDSNDPPLFEPTSTSCNGDQVVLGVDTTSNGRLNSFGLSVGTYTASIPAVIPSGDIELTPSVAACSDSLPPLPTSAPTFPPTKSPTVAPSLPPTHEPTAAPTHKPTAAPSAPTLSPTLSPTASPLLLPTRSPTVAPTFSPSAKPTLTPTVKERIEVNFAAVQTLDGVGLKAFQADYDKCSRAFRLTVSSIMSLGDPNNILIVFPPNPSPAKLLQSLSLRKGVGLDTTLSLAVRFNTSFVVGEGNSFTSATQAAAQTAAQYKASVSALTSNAFTTALIAHAGGIPALANVTVTQAPIVSSPVVNTIQHAPTASPTLQPGEKESSAEIIIIAVAVPVGAVLLGGAALLYYKVYNKQSRSDRVAPTN